VTIDEDSAVLPGAVDAIAVVGTAGGDGASTVAALLATLLGRAGGTPGVVWSRSDDPSTDRLASPAASAGAVVLDPGPADAGQRPWRSIVLACAANTAGLERAWNTVSDLERRGRLVTAVVASARTEREGRASRVRMDQASRADARFVHLPFDPALSGRSRLESDALAPSTVEAGQRLLALLQSVEAPVAPATMRRRARRPR
jgi:hypothetical protein